MYDGPSGNWLVRETGRHGRRSRDLGAHLCRPEQRRILPEQSDDRLCRVDHGARDRQRRHDSDPRGRIKWLGYLPKAHLLWNLGFYGDSLSEGQSFSTYGRQVVGRLAWVHLLSNRQPALDSRRHQRTRGHAER
jgi:hypothetical protein